MKSLDVSLSTMAALFHFCTAIAIYLPIVEPQKYNVAITSVLLTDHTRPDPFATDSRPRSVMVSSYHPTPSCQGSPSYMPPATASFQEKKFGAYGLPNGTFSNLTLAPCTTFHRPRACPDSLPTIIFSGALATSRFLYGNMLQSIAAAGYTVLSLDHPFETDIVEYPDGTLIPGIPVETDDDVLSTVDTRVADLKFVAGQLGNRMTMAHLVPGFKRGRRSARVVLIGHSLGGAAATSALLEMPLVLGAMNIDGSIFGPVLERGLDAPFMLLGHENKTRETDPSWGAIWPELKSWKREIEVKGAAHYSFSDLPIIAAEFGLQAHAPKEMEQVLGTVEGHRMAGVTVRCVLAFLNKLVKGSDGRILDGLDEDYPEVVSVE